MTLPPMSRLAGLAPAGCICELVAPGDAGEMARRDDMTAFAKEHALPCVSIVQMQEYIRVCGYPDGGALFDGACNRGKTYVPADAPEVAV